MEDELFDACRRNDVAQVQALVTADSTLLARQAPSGETPLLTALYNRSPDALAWLLEQRWPRTIWEAAAVDDIARLGALLDNDPASVDTYSMDGWTPLHLAAFFGASRAAAMLIDRGASHHLTSRNSMANTPLHAALAAKRPDVVQLLLAAGADPTVECEGYTPLAIAEGNGFGAGADMVRAALGNRAMS